MSVKRKDNKGRILRDGEIQKADGRYEFRYYDASGSEIQINTGKTYIALVPGDTWYEVGIH